VLSLEKYRARFGLVAVAALILGGAAAALLVLLDAQWARILVAAVSWAVALGLTVFLVRRARARERVRREAIAKAEARHRSLLEGMPVVAWLRETGESNETTYVGPAIA
jgi:UDP-N-acetylmuramyl pentapeptide phosphotransferase/UDP-N-acetylglucosamine-1-phosphate transferase